MINIPEETNRVLNMVKAKHGLKDKSQAITLVVDEYARALLEPDLRPQFVKKVGSIESEGYVGYRSLDDLRREINDA